MARIRKVRETKFSALSSVKISEEVFSEEGLKDNLYNQVKN
jgi:hypothetical protein